MMLQVDGCLVQVAASGCSSNGECSAGQADRTRCKKEGKSSASSVQTPASASRIVQSTCTTSDDGGDAAGEPAEAERV